MAQTLYKLGARRVLVTGTGPLGCVPAELAMRGTNGGCSAELQRAASLYNPQLVQMLRELNSKIGKDVFIAANTQRMHNDFVNNPQAFGMVASQPPMCLFLLYNNGSNVFETYIRDINVVFSAGFTTSKIACCGQGPYNGIGLCTQVSNLCPNRDQYAFWDPFHPSEKANGIIVEQIMSGSPDYMSPMNLSAIMALDNSTP